MGVLIVNGILLEQNQGKPNPDYPNAAPKNYVKLLDLDSKKILEVRLPVVIDDASFNNLPAAFQFDGFAVMGGSKGAYCVADAIHNYEPAANGRRRAEAAG